jgi:hypothetical protein
VARSDERSIGPLKPGALLLYRRLTVAAGWNEILAGDSDGALEVVPA